MFHKRGVYGRKRDGYEGSLDPRCKDIDIEVEKKRGLVSAEYKSRK